MKLINTNKFPIDIIINAILLFQSDMCVSWNLVIRSYLTISLLNPLETMQIIPEVNITLQCTVCTKDANIYIVLKLGKVNILTATLKTGLYDNTWCSSYGR